MTGQVPFLDPDQAAKLGGNALQRYRDAVAPFVRWVMQNGYNPNDAEEYDDVLVLYKNATGLKRSAFENLLAAVLFFLPRFRGRMGWSQSVLKGWVASSTIRHTSPLCAGPACWLSTHLGSVGHPRLSAGLVSQVQKGAASL